MSRIYKRRVELPRGLVDDFDFLQEVEDFLRDLGERWEDPTYTITAEDRDGILKPQSVRDLARASSGEVREIKFQLIDHAYHLDKSVHVTLRRLALPAPAVTMKGPHLAEVEGNVTVLQQMAQRALERREAQRREGRKAGRAAPSDRWGWLVRGLVVTVLGTILAGIILAIVLR